MLKRLPGIAAFRALPLLLALFPAALILTAHAAPPAPAADAGSARVQTMYTSWDDYYFYAAFRVHDTNVVGTNAATTSQPQQDDDLEVFFETDDARAKVRSTQTYQMAVSVAQGAYFSVGDGSKIPKGKAVYSYKYAVTVNGTLNKPEDTDTGYDVELAIPWSEMGRSGPPAPGAVWGFNVISRDRDSLTTPADKFYSLSPQVHSKSDVQNPSKWTRITFATGGANTPSTPEKIICAKVVGQFPRVNGTIVSGDWPATTRLSFGTDAVAAPAPTVAEEPNTTESPFDNPPPLGPAAPPTQQVEVATGMIDLPNGHGFIKVVPGGIKNPAGMVPPVITPQTPTQTRKLSKGDYEVAQASPTPAGVTVNSGAFVLGAPKPPAFVMGIYRLDFNADTRKGPGQNVWNAAGGTSLADQPMNGTGPWFSGLRTQWHRQQLSDMRQAGIEVALLRTQPTDPLLGRELDAFVEALKQMKADKLDYPLVGVDATTGQPDLDLIYAHIPAEFRAMQDVTGLGQPGVLVYDLSAGSTDAAKALADGTPIARVFYSDGIASVSPGRVDKNGVVSRQGGRTYDTSWQVALVSTPDQIVVDSWNDFAHGTEIAASRQYGEQYVDATRAQVIQYDGSRQWHAKYLSNAVPRTIFPKTLYQIPVRIENAGILPWRAGEGYSLSTRWYRDGKLFDDSAPRIPIGQDVPPGHSLTLSVGLVARDNFGEDLAPGDYTLVVDMVQGQDRWFSYAGDTPLQIPVTVIGADTGVGGTAATFLGTTTPGIAENGQSIATTVQVRNDGSSSWLATYTLGYKIQTTDLDGSNPKTIADGKAAVGSDSITPGQIASISLSIPIAIAGDHLTSTGIYRIHWFIQPDALGTLVNGSYDEPLRVSTALPSASFVLADVPRTVDAGKTETAHLALQNISPGTLKKTDFHIGYHWYYLDGTQREWDGGPTAALTQDLLPGAADGAITATFQAPKQPGRYALVWDVRDGDGPWQSTLPISGADDLLQEFVNVSSSKADLVPVDLTKAFNTVGISSEEIGKTGGFDGHGATLPAEMLPPDITSEIDGNPLLQGKPGLPLYPSGYYTAQTGTDATSNHALSFLYPAVRTGLSNT
ncbi:MAG: sugar-binding protein, partial [Janthinobacterium lividum]